MTRRRLVYESQQPTPAAGRVRVLVWVGNLGGASQQLLHLSKKCSLTPSCFLLCVLHEVLWSFYIYVYIPSHIYFCVWSELGVVVCFFTYKHPVVLAPFVEKTFLSLLNFLVPLWGLFLDSLFCFIDLFTYPYRRQCFERNLAETV